MSRCFSIFILAATLAWGANLVRNGDFEQGLDGWRGYRGTWKEPWAAPEAVPDGEEGHGRGVAVVSATQGIHTAGLQQELALPAGKRRFCISVQWKVLELQDGWVQMALQRRVKEPDGTRRTILLWSWATKPASRGVVLMKWMEASGEFSLPPDLPPGQDVLTLRLGGAKVVGRVRFDNVVLEPVAERTHAEAAARQGARPSGLNLIRDHWSYRTTAGHAPIREEGGAFVADIPPGQQVSWGYTVYSIYDNLQGPMRFSFRSRHPVNARLRCSLYPTEQKHDTVHVPKAQGEPDAEVTSSYSRTDFLMSK